MLYDNDEREGTLAATTFVEKGYDNVYLLSGGAQNATARARASDHATH